MQRDYRAALVLGVIHELRNGIYRFHVCPKIQALWLQILEGEVDDDLWLWVDGDEEWLRENLVPYLGIHLPAGSEWADAQSALRCRVTHQRYPTVTGSHGKRNETVYNATPEQRICAIVWLIANSKGVAELFASHGLTPPTFRTPEIPSILHHISGRYWNAFPSQTILWENARAKAKEDGCICSPADCRGMRQWFNMIVWLEGTPPMLEVGYECCMLCRSLLKSRHEVIVAEPMEISRLSLLDALLSYYGCYFSRHESPTAESLVTRKVGPLMKKHEPDMRYLPSINKYPHSLREHVAKQFCGWKDDFRTVKFPDDILDCAHDRWVVLGIIALTIHRHSAGEETYLHAKDMDLHDRDWHNRFSRLLRLSLDCFDLPAHPSLSPVSVRLCHKLDQDYAEQHSFGQLSASKDDFNWVYSHQDGRQLHLSCAVFVAVATFLWGKDVELYGCDRCQKICKGSFADISSAGAFEGANSRVREGLRPSSLPICGEGDALGGDRSSPFHGPLEARMPEPIGMDIFMSILCSLTLSKDEKQSWLVSELIKLRQYGDSLGLDMFDCFQLCLK
ncbi:hypothetical protein EDC04DRAFT_381297 [Pisolithus marmoratus]|nr:hypothetical protein EDC04DRAFT_381297 [Pisolithus marmoratus]